MAGTDWKDQIHQAAGRTDNVNWASSPLAVTGAATLVAAAREGRVGVFLQNVSAAESMYFGFDDTVLPATPAAGSPKYAFRLLAGEAKWEYLGEGCPVNSIYAICNNGETSTLAYYELF